MRRRGAVLVLAVALFWPPATTAWADPVPFERTPLDRWDVNGEVRDMAIVGNTLYIGGDFDALRSPDGSEQITRRNVAAIDLATGEPITDFRADTDGLVRELYVAGDGLYIAGDFSMVGGSTLAHLARVDTNTGVVDAAFDPDPNGGVWALEVIGSAVYAGGVFTTIDGESIRHLAAVNASNGSVKSGFDPDPDQQVHALRAAPDGSRLYVGGQWTRIAGVDTRWIVALDPGSGAIAGPTFGNPLAVVMDLAVSDDGDLVVAGVGGHRNSVIAYDAGSGIALWTRRDEGDVQAVATEGGNVYYGFHDGRTSDGGPKLRAVDIGTGNTVPDFVPPIDSGWGVWALDVHPGGIAVGGAFTNISGVPTRGVAFLRDPNVVIDPDDPTPTPVPSPDPDTTPPSAPSGLKASAAAGEVSLSWNASSDDTGVAYYEVVRDGVSLLSVPGTTATDNGVVSHATHTYRVRAVDVWGNTSGLSRQVDVTAPARFVDVGADNAFVADIDWLASMGITLGCNPPSNSRFCPDDPVSRGQMAAFLVRALGLTDGGSVDFADDDGSVFEADIEKLAGAEITLGCNPPANDRFCPEQAVTRQQMAAFLHRALTR